MHQAESRKEFWFQTWRWDTSLEAEHQDALESLPFLLDLLDFFLIHKENPQRCRPNPNELCCNTPARLQWIGTRGLHCSGWFRLFSGSSALGNTAAFLTGESDFVQYCSPSDPFEKGHCVEKKHWGQEKEKRNENSKQNIRECKSQVDAVQSLWKDYNALGVHVSMCVHTPTQKKAPLRSPRLVTTGTKWEGGKEIDEGIFILVPMHTHTQKNHCRILHRVI